MPLCLMSQREFTGIHTAEPDGVCLLIAGHDDDHEWTPKPIAGETAAIRYLLPAVPDLTAALEVPAWVSAHYRRPEAAA